MNERSLPPAAWNKTAKDYDNLACIGTLIRRQAEASPHAPAVRMGLHTHSYLELQHAADELAARLVAEGARSGDRIGIMLPRSLDMVVAVVAVLAIGAAYVPLDPEYPEDRLRYQLADAGIKLLVADTKQPRATLQFTGQVIALDEPGSVRTAFVPRAGLANDLAYVIYTSGSTGQPKGVAIEHGAVVNFVTWVQRTLRIGPGDVLLAQASLSFDMSVLDLFVPLTSGALIEIVPRDTVQNARELLSLISRSGATWMQATPSTWRLLVEAGLPATKAFGAIVGGEALSQDLAESLRPRLREVWNFYGPTETTVYSSAARYEGGLPLIGRPIANTQIHLLDVNGRLVETGSVGELYIGGLGLARGYLNKPDLTSSSFSEIDLGTTKSRLYKTGDLARWTSDGNLEYLGRKDRQVKVRGYRIELGEVESHLRTLPGVRDCVVLARPDVVGVQRLLGYIVSSADDQAIDPDSIKAALRARIPEYMVPSVIMLVDEFPLTPNLKIDQAALPDPPRTARGQSAGVDQKADPFDREEQIVADVWAEVLEHPITSRYADFFDCGGHSLLALMTILRLEEAFDRIIPLDTLWADGCTVAGMARIIRQLQNASPPSRLVPIRAGPPSLCPLFVIHTARGSVNEYFALASQMSGGRPVVGVRARGVYGESATSPTIEQLASDAIEAMKEMQPQGPYWVAGFSLGGLIAFEIATQLERAREDVAFVAMFDTTAPGFKPHFSISERVYWRRRQLFEAWRGEAAHRTSSGRPPQLDERPTVSRYAKAQRQALLASVDKYLPSAKYRGDVDLFVVRETARHAGEPTLGWFKWLAGNCHHHALEAHGHLDIVGPATAGELATSLERAMARHASRETSQADPSV